MKDAGVTPPYQGFLAGVARLLALLFLPLLINTQAKALPFPGAIAWDAVDPNTGQMYGGLVEPERQADDVGSAGLRTEAAISNLGVQKTLVALIQFADQSAPMSLAQIQALITGNATSLDQYIRKNSQNAAWLDVDYLDWRVLNANSTAYNQTSARQLANDSISLIDPYVNFAQSYSRVILVYSGPINSPAAGLGSLTGESLATDEGTIAPTVSWIFAPTVEIFAHEFGHNLGLHHAASATCSADDFLPISLIDPYFDCPGRDEYGDRHDTMGTDNNYLFSAPNQFAAGFIEADRFPVAELSGSYTIEDLERASSGNKGVRIPLGKGLIGSSLYYWIELRRPDALFDFTSAIQFRVKPAGYYYDPSVGGQGDLVPFSLRFKQAGGFFDIAAGSPLSDPYRGVKITVLSEGAHSATLSVEYSNLISNGDGASVFDQTIVTQSLARTITFTNGSGSPVTFLNAAITGRHSADFSITNDTCSQRALPDTATCDVSIRFQPTSHGMRFAALTLPNNNALRPKASLSLYGYGFDAAQLSSSAALDFGTVAPGSQLARDLSITNTGNAPLLVSTAEVSGSDFSLASDHCTGSSVSGGASCVLTILFRPQAVGLRNGGVTLTSNSFSSSQSFISLTGSGGGVPYLVRVIKSGSGTVVSDDGGIQCGQSCERQYLAAQTVMLRASAAAGAQFLGWHGDCQPQADGCVVSVVGPRTIFAQFSEAPATPTPAPGLAVAVTFPNGGETIRRGKKTSLRWTASPGLAKRKITLSLLKGAKTVVVIARNISISRSGRGSYSWMIPKLLKPAADYRLKLSLQGSKMSDTSDTAFTLRK